MLSAWWKGVRHWLREGPPATAQAEPAGGSRLPESVSDLVIAGRRRVGRLMHDLQQRRVPMVIQADEGRYLGRAEVFLVEADAVTLRLRLHDGAGRGRASLHVNLAGSAAQGVVMFTLALRRLGHDDLWSAPLPEEVLCVQSRRHRRVATLQTGGHRAALELPEPLHRARLLDLSEEGAGVLLDREVSAAQVAGLRATLWLDGTKVAVPALDLAHIRADGRGAWRAGLRLGGMDAADRRCLARWLDAAETAAPRGGEDQAPAASPPAVPSGARLRTSSSRLPSGRQA